MLDLSNPGLDTVYPMFGILCLHPAEANTSTGGICGASASPISGGPVAQCEISILRLPVGGRRDLVDLVTDKFTEAENPEGEFFGDRRMKICSTDISTKRILPARLACFVMAASGATIARGLGWITVD